MMVPSRPIFMNFYPWIELQWTRLPLLELSKSDIFHFQLYTKKNINFSIDNVKYIISHFHSNYTLSYTNKLRWLVFVLTYWPIRAQIMGWHVRSTSVHIPSYILIPPIMDIFAFNECLADLSFLSVSGLEWETEFLHFSCKQNPHSDSFMQLRVQRKCMRTFLYF